MGGYVSGSRRGHVWTADKLEFLRLYLPAFVTACKKAVAAGAELHYVDGFAGEGKNDIDGTLVNGSPLLALEFGFHRFHFVEANRAKFKSLKAHIDIHPRAAAVSTLKCGDFNKVVHAILGKIPSFSPAFFFLDPEGLELHWDTVAAIAQRERADVFVLVSGSGIIRNWHQPGAATRFFGSEDWKTIDITTDAENLGKDQFTKFVDLYAQQLRAAGLKAVDQRITARLPNGAKLHAFVFASKRAVANKIATDIIEKMNLRDQNSLFES